MLPSHIKVRPMRKEWPHQSWIHTQRPVQKRVVIMRIAAALQAEWFIFGNPGTATADVDPQE